MINRSLLLLLLSILFTLNVIAQHGFQLTFGDSQNSEYIHQAIELKSGDFIITANSYSSLTSDVDPYLALISSDGYIIKDTIYKDVNSSFSFINITDFNNKIVLFSIKLPRSGVLSDSLIFAEIDTSLCVSNVKKIHFADSLSSGNVKMKAYDDFLLISGSLDSINPSAIGRVNAYLWKIDTNYLISNSRELSSSVNNKYDLYDVIVDDNKKIYSYYNYAVYDYRSHKIVFNEDLSVDSIYYQNYGDFYQYVYFEKVKSKLFMIAMTKVLKPRIYSMNTNYDTNYSFVYWNSNIDSYSATARALSSYNNYIFAGVTENVNRLNPWWGMQNSNYYVVKMDSLGNKIWESRIGNSGNYYILYDVLATSDGGCLLSGSVYNYLSNSYQKDMFITKLDSNGTTTWTQNIKVPQVKLTIFPNPTSQSINIVLVANDQIIKEYQIFDLQGKLVLQKQIDAKQYKINVQSLARGVYIIEGVTNTGAPFGSRFVKE